MPAQVSVLRLPAELVGAVPGAEPGRRGGMASGWLPSLHKKRLIGNSYNCPNSDHPGTLQATVGIGYL